MFILGSLEVCNIHFSGELKMWDRLLPVDTGESDAAFAERFLLANMESYPRWVLRSAPADEYLKFCCALRENGRICLVANGSDVTPLVDLAVEQLRMFTVHAASEWRQCAERLAAEAAKDCVSEDEIVLVNSVKRPDLRISTALAARMRQKISDENGERVKIPLQNVPVIIFNPSDQACGSP